MHDFALPLGCGLFAAALAARRPAKWFIPRPTRPIAPAWIIVRRGICGCEKGGFANMAIRAVVTAPSPKVQGPAQRPGVESHRFLQADERDSRRTGTKFGPG